MANTSLQNVLVGGYQGSSSVLSQGLQHFCGQLQSKINSLEFELTLDVTTEGMTARSLFDSVENGSRKICYLASSYLSARVSDLRVLDIPFSVDDRTAALQRLDGKAGELLAQSVEKNTKLKLLAFWDNGFRHISNKSRPLRGPADCQGLKIRTLDSQAYCDVLSAIGFAPVVIDVLQLRTAVSTGQVDAQENPLTNFIHFELWRHHPYLSLTKHFFGVALLVCNRQWFDELGEYDQSAMLSAALSATQLQRRLAALEDEKALLFLKDCGTAIVNPTEFDIGAMQDACRSVSSKILAPLRSTLVESYLQNGGSYPR